MNQFQIHIGQEIFPTNQQNQFGLQYKITSKANAQNNDSVYFATEKIFGNNQREVVLKFMNLQNVQDSEKNFLGWIKDLQSQNNQDSPNQIIKILNIFEYKHFFVIAMEKGQIDLFTYLKEQRINLSLQEKVKICLEITSSIHILHKNHAIHRDIKPEHYLKVGDQFKLIGFGRIKVLQYDRILTKGIGTPIFQAPEVVEAQQDYSDKMDIWSLACVFYEIFSPNPLFNYNNYQQIQEKILNHKKNSKEINDKINQLFFDFGLKQLMIKMLEPDPNLRLNSEQVMEELEKIKSNLSKNFNFGFPKFQQQPNNNFGQAINNVQQNKFINPESQPRLNYLTQCQQQNLQNNQLFNQKFNFLQNFNINQQNAFSFQSTKNIEELMNQKFKEQLQNFKMVIGQELKTIILEHIEKLFKQYFEQHYPLQNNKQQIYDNQNTQIKQDGSNQEQIKQIILLLESQKSELISIIQNQQQNDQNIRQQYGELQAKIQIDKNNFNQKVNQIYQPFQYDFNQFKKQNLESIDKQLNDFLSQLNVNIGVFDFLFEEICIKKNEQIMEKILGFQRQYHKQGFSSESFSNNIQRIIQQKSMLQQLLKSQQNQY